MKNTGIHFSSGRISKVRLFLLVGPLALFIIALVIVFLYQATTGNGSLSEISRNVSLPAGAENEFQAFTTPISSLTFQEVQSAYGQLNDDQWRAYASGILGSRVGWSGKVSSIERRRVEIDMGSAPLRYLVLMGVSEKDKARLSIGDSLAFEGRLQSFHLVRGMNSGLDNVRIK